MQLFLRQLHLLPQLSLLKFVSPLKFSLRPFMPPFHRLALFQKLALLQLFLLDLSSPQSLGLSLPLSRVHAPVPKVIDLALMHVALLAAPMFVGCVEVVALFLLMGMLAVAVVLEFRFLFLLGLMLALVQ